MPVKVTGQVYRSSDGGGELTFMGRKISRHPGHSDILLSVDDQYLAGTYEEFGIKSGSSVAPDVAAHLEVSDPNAKKPLSAESFRRCLGKLFGSQSRHDLKLWLSLENTTGGFLSETESAIRSMLPTCSWVCSRTNMRAWSLLSRTRCHRSCARLPTLDSDLIASMEGKAISGSIVMFEGGVVRAFVRRQQALFLSSCKAEIYAVQLLSQEAVAFSYFTHRLLYSIGEVSEPESIQIMFESDSSSALQLLYAEGLPRRSRHIEIRLLWLQEQMKINKIKVKHRAGTGMDLSVTFCSWRSVGALLVFLLDSYDR